MGRKRVPSLSDKPDTESGRYYCTYRNNEGKPRKRKFTKSRSESLVLFGQWLAQNYAPDGSHLLIRSAADEEAEAERVIACTLPHIVKDFLAHEFARVRPDTAVERKRGTISIKEYNSIEYVVRKTYKWLKNHFNDAVRTTPFAEMLRPRDYEAMMLFFSHKHSASTVNKLRIRFWDMVKFARWEPYNQSLPFHRDDFPSYGGKVAPKKIEIIPKDMLQGLMRYTDLRGRLWFWLGLGLGFGQTDLANLREGEIGKDYYDMPRPKTGMERSGKTPPFVWTLLKDYLKQNPRGRGELIFLTKTGLPVVRRETKTDDEIKYGTLTHNAKECRIKETDVVSQWWKRIQQCSGITVPGFYHLRHIGATAYAIRVGGGSLEIRTFLGHGDTRVADKYLKAYTSGVRPTIDWVNKVLSSKVIMAWEDIPKQFEKAQKELAERARQKGKKHKKKLNDEAD